MSTALPSSGASGPDKGVEIANMDIFHSLAGVRWDVASQTRGNDHATLIGLMVEWWISRDIPANWALEGGPTFNPRGSGMRDNGTCDAILGSGQDAVGVLEVEGMRPVDTVKKLGRFFASSDEHFRSLQFAIILLYPCAPKGRGEQKAFLPAGPPDVLKAIAKVSIDHHPKDLFVVTVEKKSEPGLRGILARSPYYAGRVSEVQGIWYRNGQQCEEVNLWHGVR
jgi:hypothetical protein